MIKVIKITSPLNEGITTLALVPDYLLDWEVKKAIVERYGPLVQIEWVTPLPFDRITWLDLALVNDLESISRDLEVISE